MLALLRKVFRISDANIVVRIETGTVSIKDRIPEVKIGKRDTICYSDIVVAGVSSYEFEFPVVRGYSGLVELARET